MLGLRKASTGRGHGWNVAIFTERKGCLCPNEELKFSQCDQGRDCILYIPCSKEMVPEAVS